MELDYNHLSQKLKLLARPRIRVSGSEEALRVELLQRRGSDEVLAAYDFQAKDPTYNLLRAENMLAMSNFMETAALMLERKNPDEHPVSFSQNLYNEGFWMNPANACDWLTCEITALEYDAAKWAS